MAFPVVAVKGIFTTLSKYIPKTAVKAGITGVAVGTGAYIAGSGIGAGLERVGVGAGEAAEKAGEPLKEVRGIFGYLIVAVIIGVVIYVIYRVWRR